MKRLSNTAPVILAAASLVATVAMCIGALL